MAKYSFVDLGLPELPLISGGNDAVTGNQLEPDLRYLYFAIQNLAQSVGQQLQLDEPLDGFQDTAHAAESIGLNKRRLYAIASENIAYGELVHIWTNAGALNARLADASDTTRPCFGISNSTGTITAGNIVEVVLPGAYVTSVAGLTPGTTYYLSPTAGALQNTAPTGAAEITQIIGFAISATEFYFNPLYGFDGSVASGSFTLNGTGFTTVPVATMYYSKRGSMVIMELSAAVSATSNATTMTFGAIPTNMRPANAKTVMARVQDNGGVWVFARADIGTDGVINFFTDVQGAVGFTAAGTKSWGRYSFSYTLN